MLNIVLIMHVFGAALLGVAMLLTLRDLYSKKTAVLPKHVRRLSFGLFFEIATGSVLAMLTPSFSLLAFCQNIAIYVFVVALFVFFVYRSLAVHEKLVLFPRRFIAVTTFLSVLSTFPVFFFAFV